MYFTAFIFTLSWFLRELPHFLRLPSLPLLTTVTASDHLNVGFSVASCQVHWLITQAGIPKISWPITKSFSMCVPQSEWKAMLQSHSHRRCITLAPECSHTVNLWSQKRARAHLQGNMKNISQTSGEPLYRGEGLFNCCAMFQGNGGVSSASWTGNHFFFSVKVSIYLVSVPNRRKKKLRSTIRNKKTRKPNTGPFVLFPHAIQAGTPDGTFPTWFGFMSFIHLVKSPKKVFGKQAKAERVVGWASCRLQQNKPSKPIRLITVRYSHWSFICKSSWLALECTVISSL